METCFLFVHDTFEDAILSLSIEAGEIVAPLQKRTIEALLLLQQQQAQIKMVLVIPTRWASLHDLILPRLSDQKLRAAIPYAIEEQVAQSLTDCHFAFDKYFNSPNGLLVAAIDKSRMQYWIEKCIEAHLRLNSITLDWFALQPHEACVTSQGLLVHDDVFKGAVQAAVVPLLKQYPLNLTSVYHFGDSQDVVNEDSFPASVKSFMRIEESSFVWLAKRLYHNPSINLCQGIFKAASQQKRFHFSYQHSLILFGCWLLGLLLIPVLHLSYLNRQINTLDTQIASIYQHFFPGSSVVVDPETRIRHWVKAHEGNQDVAFWTLTSQLSTAVADDPVKIQINTLSYQHHLLLVTLHSQSFAALTNLKHQLNKAGVHVHQTQAISKQKQVLATLELTI